MNWLSEAITACVRILLQDVRYALRALAAAPTFTVAAILSLAIGIGANTAIFSIVDGLLLRPLPYADAERLVILWNRSPGLNITEDCDLLPKIRISTDMIFGLRGEQEMTVSKHSEAQIIGALKQIEAGRTAADVARECGVSKHTIYAWKGKYGGMEVNEAQRLRSLEDENARLKRLVADLSLDREMHKAVIAKNGLGS